MASSKLSALTAKTTVAPADLFYLVFPGDADPDRNITGENLATALYALLEIDTAPENQNSPGTKGQWHDDGAGKLYRHNGTQWTVTAYADTFDNS